MTPVERDPASLRQHITGTYLGLRLGIAVIGTLLPIAVWSGARYLEGYELLGSLSMYYHTAMRDVFVGGVIAIGVCLYLYKGFSRAENVALNLAGMFAVCLALIPTQNELIEPLPPRTGWNDFHIASAALFFLCIAYVSIFRASDTLLLIRNTEHARYLRSVYWVLGALMVVLPVSALIASELLARPGSESKRIFFLEAAGAWAFAAYWLVKSWEMSRTEAERDASEGTLQASTSKELPGRLIQTAPTNADTTSFSPGVNANWAAPSVHMR